MSERFKVTKAAEPAYDSVQNAALKDDEAAFGKLLPSPNEKRGEFILIMHILVLIKCR